MLRNYVLKTKLTFHEQAETKKFTGRMHQDDMSLLVSIHSPQKSSDANEANVTIFTDDTVNKFLVL
jgi:hypothetical protein